MEQLQINFNTTGVNSKLSEYINRYSESNTAFNPVHVYDKISGQDTYAIKCTEDWIDVPIRLNIIIIPNETFAVLGYLYFDTVSKDSSTHPVGAAKLSYSTGGALDVVCYMNFSLKTKVVNINKNLHTILNAFYINTNITNFFRVPSPTDKLPDWVTYNPSVGMYVIKSDFVLNIEEDYSNVPTCFYRSGYATKTFSILYKYANEASTSICSNEYLEDLALKDGRIARCLFDQVNDIKSCPFYKEDKMQPFKTELYSVHNQDSPIAVIDCYIIREILGEHYSIVFEKTDVSTGNTVILKKFSYANTSDKLLAQPDGLISEALLQNHSLLSDYTSDYKINIINYVQSFVELKKKPESNIKPSYLSTLVS